MNRTLGLFGVWPRKQSHLEPYKASFAAGSRFEHLKVLVYWRSVQDVLDEDPARGHDMDCTLAICILLTAQKHPELSCALEKVTASYSISHGVKDKVGLSTKITIYRTETTIESVIVCKSKTHAKPTQHHRAQADSWLDVHVAQDEIPTEALYQMKCEQVQYTSAARGKAHK